MKANVGRIANILPIFAFNNSNTAYTTAKITGSKKAKNKPTLKSVFPTLTVAEPNAPDTVFVTSPPNAASNPLTTVSSPILIAGKNIIHATTTPSKARTNAKIGCFFAEGAFFVDFFVAIISSPFFHYSIIYIRILSKLLFLE